MLHLVEVALHQVQSINAGFELVRKFPKERRQPRVFKLIELGDDEVALLASLDEVNEVLQPLTPQPEVVNAFGEHSRQKQRVIADILAHLEIGRASCRERV